MNGIFEAKKNLNDDINNWDVSNVKNMDEMFFKCKINICMFNIFYGTLINNSSKWYKKI